MEATKQRAASPGRWRSSSRSCAPTRSSTRRRRASCCRTRPTSRRRPTGSSAETIGFLPRRRHGIRPVPDALAPIYTGGRGGLEACLMNTYNLPARPLYTLASLTLHECTPGHSFQAALALEGPERPPFRRGHVVLRLRRRVGTLHRVARHGHGHLRDALRGLRPADVRDVARVPAGHRHRHPPVRLDARAGDGLPARERARSPSTRSRPRSSATSRGRARRWPTSLARSRSAVIGVRRRRSSAPRSTSGSSTTRSWRSARCRCRCWSSAWRSSSPTAASNPPPTAR